MLTITNLPAHVRPSHITHILSHTRLIDRETGEEGAVRRVDPGVSMVQIYTMPRKSAKRTRPSPSFSKARTTPSRSATLLVGPIGSESKPDSEPYSDAPPAYALIDDPESQRHTARARELLETVVSEAEVVPADDEGEEGHGDVEEEEEERGVVGRSDDEEKEEEMETVAYVHFRDEFALWRAKDLLKNVTVDGRKIGYKTNRWDMTPLKRLWRDWLKGSKGTWHGAAASV